MKTSAEALFHREGDVVSADDWNAVIAAQRRRRPAPGFIRGRPRPFVHPWKVTTEHRADDARSWRINVAPAVVNDTVPTIPYLRANDPRGWLLPPNDPRQKDPAPQSVVIEREITERIDPPYLTVTTPSASGEDLGDFIKVADSSRPEYFRTAEMWEKDVYRASVILSATPYAATRSIYFPRLLPTTLKKFRLMAGRLPSRTDGVKAGDFIELARLFLVRTPNAEPAADEIVVQQKVFWCLMSAVIEPTLDLGQVFDLASLMPGLNDLADLIAAGVNDDLASAASVAFWSV